jgi:hypothetical protein
MYEDRLAAYDESKLAHASTSARCSISNGHGTRTKQIVRRLRQGDERPATDAIF